MITVTGSVSDATTGEGLASATLAVNGKAVGAAGSSGNFTLNLESYNDTITASSVGYAPLTLPAYQVAEGGGMQLGIADDPLQPAVVTATAKKVSPWWILAGVAVVASTSKPGTRRMSGTGSSGSNLVPLALLGVGAYLILRPKTPVYPTYPGTTYPYPSPTPVSPGNTGIFSPGNITSIVDIFKNLFGSNSSASSPTSTYSSYDPSPAGGDIYAGMGATTSINAGDIIGHTLVAAKQVPLYDEARDGAQPSGYVNAGNPIGIVSSYLSPDTSKGRAELWWMFEPLSGNSDIGYSQGFYYVPHNPDYFDTKALTDSGVLTVAQATALKNGEVPSTAEKLLDKYVPWLIGGIVAIGIGKAIINKAI
jgi:hypothetical protein